MALPSAAPRANPVCPVSLVRGVSAAGCTGEQHLYAP